MVVHQPPGFLRGQAAPSLELLALFEKDSYVGLRGEMHPNIRRHQQTTGGFVPTTIRGSLESYTGNERYMGVY